MKSIVLESTVLQDKCCTKIFLEWLVAKYIRNFWTIPTVSGECRNSKIQCIKLQTFWLKKVKIYTTIIINIKPKRNQKMIIFLTSLCVYFWAYTFRCRLYTSAEIDLKELVRLPVSYRSKILVYASY